jgi:zinc metalloprotease ZmpB
VLPGFLQTRGWALHLDNPGGASFSLGPRGTREIRLRMVGGQSFTKAEVLAAGRVAIELVVLVDGLVVGGLTYLVDPELRWPAREWEHHEDEEQEHHPDPEEDGEHRHSPRAIHLKIDID